MPRWLNRLREGSRGAGGGTALLERPESPAFELPADLPAGVDGALWASWAARWQEF
jgi:hypothetical protein